MTHRFYRLHNVEVPISWTAPTIIENIVRDVKLVPKSVVLNAVNSVSNWYIKGKLQITSPPVGTYEVSWGGTTIMYAIYEPDSNYGIWAISGWFYRRWYQEIEVVYSATIDLGGASDRDDVISARLSADFDAGAWESPAAVDTPLGIYSRNVPEPPPGPTGYEALSGPWPPQNGHVDHYGSIDAAAVENAMRHVMAKATRKIVSGQRRQQVEFSRPLDPRFEIGSSIGVNFFGVIAIGQLVDISHTLDCNNGDATTMMRLACPTGNGSAAEFTVDFTAYSATISHDMTGFSLQNRFGSANDTSYVAPPNDADLAGWFVNTGGLSEYFDIAAPVYNEQFRIVLPEISAELRDPIKVDEAILATVGIPDSLLEITF